MPLGTNENNMTGYILGVDTSSSLGLCFVASQNRDVLNFKYIDAKSSHAELIFSAIQDVLENTGITMQDISTVVYTAGPGSFTGLRIAYSAVRGFVMAEPKIKAHGVSSLKVLLHNLSDVKTKKFSLISGSKNELYIFAKNEKGDVLVEQRLFDVDEFIDLVDGMSGKKTFIGSGALEYKDRLLLLKGASVPEGDFETNRQHRTDPHIIKPEGVLSLLDENGIDGINYLKASYAETNLQKKAKIKNLAK